MMDRSCLMLALCDSCTKRATPPLFLATLLVNLLYPEILNNWSISSVNFVSQKHRISKTMPIWETQLSIKSSRCRGMLFMLWDKIERFFFLFLKKGRLDDLAQDFAAHCPYPHIHTDPTARSRPGKLREPSGIKPAATDPPVRQPTDRATRPASSTSKKQI